MKCNAAIALLPWFLNDTLAAEEKVAVRDHLKGCAACRQELEDTYHAWRIFDAHPRPEDLIALAGEPDTVEPERRPLLERHLEQCARCRDEVQLIRESRQHFLGSEGAATTTAPVVGAMDSSMVPANDNRPGPGWRLAAAAAMILTLVTASGWWVSYQQRRSLHGELVALEAALRDAETGRLTEASARQHLEAERQAVAERAKELESQRVHAPANALQPQLNLPVVDIYPEDMVLRGGSGPKEETIQRPTVGEGIVFILGSQSAAQGPFALEVLEGSRVAWRGEGLRRQERGEFTVTLPAAILPRGPLTFQILDSSGKVVERYRVRLVP
jgi:hypothetical protein